jgi:hypothetical protein
VTVGIPICSNSRECANTHETHASRFGVRCRRRFSPPGHRHPSSRHVNPRCREGIARERRVNRYYDPATGQFLSVDPDVAETGQPYAYTDDDPVNAIDPDGLDCGIFSVVCGAYDSAAGGVKTAAKDTGSFVYQHASTLSTIASGLATVAYLSCAVTEGVGCGVGLLLSAASTGLAGVNTYRACFGGAGGCATAATSLGLSVVATGAGIGLQNAAEGGLANVFNAYSRDIYLARQAGVIGAGLNGLSTLYSLLSDYAFGCG